MKLATNKNVCKQNFLLVTIPPLVIYKAKNTHVATINSVDTFQRTCYQQADIRMRLHGLRQLVDD